MKYSKALFVTIIALIVIMAGKAKAGTQEELVALLGQKVLVYNGTCYFDKKGILTFKNEEKKTVKRCLVAMDLPDQTKHYLLILDQEGVTELLVYDEPTKQQKSLWRKGKMV